MASFGRERRPLLFDGFEVHTDHVVVGVGARCEFGIEGRVEHAAFDDDGNFRSLVIGRGEAGCVGTAGDVFERHEIAADLEPFKDIGDAAVGGDEFDFSAGARFRIAGKADGEFVAIADADVDDARSFLDRARPHVDEKCTDDASEDD